MEYPVGVGNLISKLTLELGTDVLVGIPLRLGGCEGLTSQLITGLIRTLPVMQVPP